MQKFTRILLWTLIFLLFFQWITKPQEDRSGDDVVIYTASELTIGKEVSVKVINQSEETLIIPSNCPANPLNVEMYSNGAWTAKTGEVEEEKCNTAEITLEPGADTTLSFAPWNNQVFDTVGKYRISLETTIGNEEKIFMDELEIKEVGIFRRFFRGFFYKPIYNTLIYLIKAMPGHDLGWAIILLTLIIKVILLGPNQKALKAQKRMQKVQPQLDALKKKYANDQQRLAQETMKLWQQYKVNPMDSCLPILVQFPILIALFYVVRDFNTVNPHLLYEPFKNFDVTTIHTHFLGIIELTEKSLLALPIIIGLLQFTQMKLSFSKLKDKGNLPAANKAMLFGLPIMIAVFTASLPAAVGFYWGTSTLFGIGQQAVVNRSKD